MKSFANKSVLLCLLSLFAAATIRAQAPGLYINEVSQGPSGSKEYVELIVVGTPTCYTIPTLDLRGWYIDDNNGFHATGAGTGIAQGCVRFTQDPLWAAVPIGTIIVIHNDADVNAAVPAADLSMSDGNCRLIIPVSNCALLERHTTLPSTAVSTYQSTGFTSCGSWTNISMANGDDSFQTIDPAGNLFHSVSWGNNTLSTIIYFAGSSAGMVAHMTNAVTNNITTQANWARVAVGGNESPGSPNNAANQAWICSMNNGCTPLLPISLTGSQTNASCTCTGSATVNASGGFSGCSNPYTYSWAPSGGSAATASGLCAGTYTVTVSDVNGCSATRTVTITAATSFTLSTTQTNVSCNGGTNGSATVTVSGGTGPFTYSWAPSGGTGSTATGLPAGTYTVTVTDAAACAGTATVTITQPPALTATQSQVNVLCNGQCTGSATVAASGGTAPYTYAWAPAGGTTATASALCAGTYTCTITDANGCPITRTFNITQPPALATTGSQVNVLCNGNCTGSATVVASGGTAPYAYTWAPSGGTAATASALCAGTYTVTITDANGCITTRSFTITQPPALTTTGSQVNILCNGTCNGSATVVASGGTAPYTYSWAPSGGTAATASALCAGTYTATVTDANGCITTRSFTITQPPALTTTGSQVNILCNGGNTGSATVTASGGTAPYTYSWAPSGGTGATATGLTAGNYTVTVTDANGCTITRTYSITQPPALATTGSQVNVLCNGGTTGSATVMASGGTAPYAYSWAPSGGTSATATGLGAGTYTVTVTDANGCTISQTYTITQPPALTASATNTPATCGNPNGTATVTASGGTAPYSYSWAPSGGTGTTASALLAGSYTVTVTDANGCMTTATTIIANTGGPTASITTIIDVSCNGGSNGSATATVSGGTAPYTYAWTPSGGTGSTGTGLAAGNYTVTVTDVNGCITTTSVTITEPPALTTTGSQVNILCNGGSNGSATVVASGGTAPYAYAWSPSGGTGATATGLSAGNYTATVTDANGCTTTQTFAITQPPVLATTSSQVNVLCNGQCNGSATISASGGTAPYTYAWAPSGGTAATATALCAGSYTVTVTDANGCTISQTYTITQPPALTASTTATPATCGSPNGSATVTASGGTAPYSYSWTPAGGTAATATGLIAGSYTVTITDANGCTTTATANVANTGGPGATITSSANILCFGGSNGSATVTASGGTAPYSYSWAPAGGTGATATALIAGSYTVTVTDANGCITTASVTLTEPPALAASATSTPVLCNGGTTGTAGVTASGGTAPYTYAWAPSGGTGSSATGLAAGTYTVTITDAGGCTTTATTTVTQPTAITATASSTPVLCNGGNTGAASVNVSGGTTPYTYSWSPSGGTGSSATSLTAGAYTITITDASGCVTNPTVTVTEPTALAASTTTTPATCGNPNGSASVTASGGTTAYTYSWTPSGGTGATATGLPAGIYAVTITDASGCTLTATANVTNAGGLSATISASTDVSCFGGNDGSATVAASGGTAPYTYAWTPSGGTGTTGSGLIAGSYTVTVTDANSCTATASVTIMQPPVLTASVSVNPVLCNGGNSGSANVAASGGTPGYTYNWSPSGGTSASATNLAATTYTCTVTDANGCITTASAAVTEPAALSATGSQTDVSCNGGTNGTATVTASGGTAPFTYSWSPSGGTGTTATGLAAQSYSVTITDANGCALTQPFSITQPAAVSVTTSTIPATCGSANGSATAVASGGTGSYSYLWTPGNMVSSTISNTPAGNYTVTVTDQNGCTGNVAATINNSNSPVAVLSASSGVSCFGGNNGSASVSASGGTGTLSYSWSNGDTTTTTSLLTAGTYTLIVTDQNGCTDSILVTIPGPPQLVLSTTQTDVLCNGGTTGNATASASGGVGPYSYVWSNNDPNPSTTGLAAGPWLVTVTDSNGCTSTAGLTITEPQLLTLLSSGTNVSCFAACDGLLSVTANGGTGGYAYSWSSGCTVASCANACAGAYTITVTDSNGCVAVDSVIITEPLQLTASVTSTDAHCTQADGSVSASATGGTGNLTINGSADRLRRIIRTLRRAIIPSSSPTRTAAPTRPL